MEGDMRDETIIAAWRMEEGDFFGSFIFIKEIVGIYFRY
jgi:hypothetical protein